METTLASLVEMWIPVRVDSTAPSKDLTPSSYSGLASAAAHHGLLDRLETEEARACEEGQLAAHVASLVDHFSTCVALQGAVSGMLGQLDRIDTKHAEVTTTTSEFLGQCTTLLRDQDRMKDIVCRIEAPLRYFDNVSRLGKALGMDLTEGDQAHNLLDEHSEVVAVMPENPEFTSVLRDVDECVAFFILHPNYFDAASYLAKFRSLLVRGVTLLRNVVVSTLEATTSAILAGRKGGVGAETQSQELVSELDNFDTLPEHVRCRAQAPHLRCHVAEIERRAADHAPLLRSVLISYDLC